MKKPVLLAFALIATMAARSADPYIAYVYPAGLQTGTTNRVLVGGQAFWGNLEAAVSGDGIEVLSVDVVPGFSIPGSQGQRNHLKAWLDGIAAGNRAQPPLPKDPRINEWRECLWWRRLGELDADEIALVEYDLFVPKNALQMSPSLRQKAFVTLAVAKDAKPGRRDMVLYTSSSASAPHALFVSAAPHVKEPLYVPPHRRKGKPLPVPVRLSPPFVLDGQILPGETDRFALSLAKGDRLRFTAVAREMLPYIGDAVPGFFNAVLCLTGPDGSETAFADDDSFRPDPVMTADIPVSGEYVLEVRDNLYRGREDFVYMITCEKTQATDSASAPEPSGSSGTSVFAGMFSAEGVVPAESECRYEFDIPEPCARVIEVEARSAGSSLDPVVELYAPRGRWPFSGRELLQTWDDVTNVFFVGSVAQAECDPVGYYEFKKPGRYTLSVRDRTGAGGNDYRFKVTVREPVPDFVVYAARSVVPVREGVRTKFPLKVVRREGFTGDVKILDLPELRFVKGTIPAESNDVSAVAVGRVKNPFFKETEIFAEGVVDGRKVRRRVVPADEVQQAFAWQHLIPADTFRLVFPKWIPPPPRARGWPVLPEKLYADIRFGTNAVADVAASADSLAVAETVARRRLRWRRLVRAGSETVPSRKRMNELLLAGVTEFYAPGGEPFSDPYAMRLMGMVQNAAPDCDVLVYAPTSSLSVVHAEQRKLLEDGWCVDLLPEDRVEPLTAGVPYRTIFVPSVVKMSSNDTVRLVSKVNDLGWRLVFEDVLPRWVEGEFKEKGKCRVAQLPKKRGSVVTGPRNQALSVAGARREPLKAGKVPPLRCSRWKDGPEYVYFIVNPGDAKVVRRFTPSVSMMSATVLDPATGSIKDVKVDKRTVTLSLAPHSAIFLRTYPWRKPAAK